MGLRIKNWNKHQHYKHRNPPWIKLHRSLLDDPEWFALSGDASKLLANCWLVASDNNGELPPMKDLAFRLRMKVDELTALISELDHWLEDDASKVLSDCKQDASGGDPQRQSTETESEKSKYRFAGKTIRLTDSLYDSWKDNFPDIDLDATLRELDAMISMEGGSGSPFRVSALLRHRQEKAKAKRGRLLAPYKPFTPDPPEKEKPPQEKREAQVEKWKRMRGKNALVRGDDEGEEGTTSELAPKEARVPDVLPALQAMDYATEDET